MAVFMTCFHLISVAQFAGWQDWFSFLYILAFWHFSGFEVLSLPNDSEPVDLSQVVSHGDERPLTLDLYFPAQSDSFNPNGFADVPEDRLDNTEGWL